MTTKPTELYVPIPKGAMERINIMAFACQLERLYRVGKVDGKIQYVAGLCGPYFTFSNLYDHLTENGFKIEFQVEDGKTQEDVKKILWKMAFNNSWLQVIQNGREQSIRKDIQIKLYKSELIYLCLVQHFNLSGKELSFDNEDGTRIKGMYPIGHTESENNIIEYLNLKASQLIEN